MTRWLGSGLTFLVFSVMGGEAEFARDIQPIFAKHCYECHGTQKQKGELRLDDKTSVFKSAGRIVVPGKASESELFRRVTLDREHEDFMPRRGEALSKRQINLIRDWIDRGAHWPANIERLKHWAYVPPKRPSLPKVKSKAWPKNEIDYFILARLEKEHLNPSSRADKARLIRRVYLDLIGLPPTPQQVDAFLNDKRPDAYEQVVDALLRSPHYGERWARPWLDLARYADSLGYQRDDLWSLWPYRDWVIKALNADMPFDQFTIEQLAGDLLPNATQEQKVATGFNRCTAINVEAGSDQNETRVNQIIDRVNTTATVWLGSTIECAQCHDHKYDPFSQKEYFQLFTFFNNTPQETDFTSSKSTAALRFTGPYLNLASGAFEAGPNAQPEEQPEEQSKKTPKPRHILSSGQPPRALVMQEEDMPRKSTVFIRGSFLEPGDSVQPDVPAILPPLPEGPRNRLTLARWLASTNNPLVARITVNRWWAEIFGKGLVATLEDFGIKGELPTHPELLDWLAVDFMEHGWSTKRIHRLILTSATYRQSAAAGPASWENDRQNLLLARGPRTRMDAEMIRDNALSVSGLLSMKQGGPPVRPYQPPGLWEGKVGGDRITYEMSQGEDQYRRGIYTIWKRTSPYPSFVTFDAPNRTVCVVQRTRSNTPLQALALLNDPVYVEAARSLAKRVLSEIPSASLQERIRYAFRLCTARMPTSRELGVLMSLYRQQLQAARHDPKSATSLAASAPVLDTAEFCAWYSIASVLLNLDETITKG